MSPSVCACGKPIKTVSEKGVFECWSCGQKTRRAEEAEYAAKVEAMPVPAWAEGDPFLDVAGGELAAYSNHGKRSKGVRL